MDRNSNFIKYFFTLASGSIIAQLITMLCSPILTRLYTPEEMGYFTFILTIVNIFGPIVNGRYDLVIVTEKKEKNIYALIKVSLIISLISSICVVVGYYLYSLSIDSNRRIILNCIFIFILLNIFGLTNVLNSYNNRKKEYRVMSIVYVIRTGTQNLGSIVSGIAGGSIYSLLFFQTFSQMLGFKWQAKSILKHKQLVIKVSIKEQIQIMKKYYHQVLFSVPAAFANSFSYSSLNIFIQSLYGMETLGFYSISFRALGMPLAIISTNLSKVFFENASQQYNENKIFIRAYKQSFKILIILAIPMVIGIISLAPYLFKLVFGPAWIIAGKYIQILAPMFGIRLIGSALSLGYLVANKQKAEFIFQISFLVIAIGIYLLCKVKNLNIEIFLMLISIGFSLIYIFEIIHIYILSKKGEC